MREPHPNSRLKRTDDAEWMEAVYRYKLGDAKAVPPVPRHTLAETEAWLATQDVQTNAASLSEFVRWYPLWRKMQRANDVTATVKDILSELPGLNLESRRIEEVTQAVFEAEALQKGDSKLHVALKQLRQRDQMLALEEKSAATKARQKDAQIAQKEKDLALAERRVAVLEDNAAKAKQQLEAVKKTGGLSAEALKQIEEAAKLL